MDSAEDICGAIRQSLSGHLENIPSVAELTRYVGYHLDVCYGDLLPHYTRGQIEQIILDYRAAYPARKHASTRVFPGVKEALSELGSKKATATTKGTPMTRAVLEQFGLIQWFDHVQGTDGFPCKPEPDVLLRSLAALEIPPDECLFVGDSAADMEAGRRAGVSLCAVSYGYGNREDMTRWNPEFWIDDLRELL